MQRIIIEKLEIERPVDTILGRCQVKRVKNHKYAQRSEEKLETEITELYAENTNRET